MAGGQSANETSRPTAGRVITGTRSRVHEEELKKKREGGEKGREEGRKEGVSGGGSGHKPISSGNEIVLTFTALVLPCTRLSCEALQRKGQRSPTSFFF